MDDRDFLGYFTELGSKNTTTLKQASNNIVSTLLALDSKTGKTVVKPSIEDSDDDEKVAKEKVNKKA